MLITLLLLFAALSHAHPVRQIGPLPTVSEQGPLPSLETLPELSEVPLPSEVTSFVPPFQTQVTIEPTDVPPLASLPPFVPTEVPPDDVTTATPGVFVSPSSSPDDDRRVPSPIPIITSSSAPLSTPSSSLSATPSPFIIVSSPVEESPTVEDTSPSVEEVPTPQETDDPTTMPTSQTSEEDLATPPPLEPLPTAEESDIPIVSATPELTISPQSPDQEPPVAGSPPETVPPSQRTPCFPASATVRLSDGSIKMMKHLSVGDEVHIGGNKYSKVHMFTHRDYDTWAVFVRLTTSSGLVLKVTGGHFVYVGDTLRPVRDVRIGDRLPTAEGTWTTVTSIQQVIERGLYNPQLLEGGDIVVDGIRASVYTEAIKPAIAHAALLPLRAAFNMFGFSTQCADQGYPKIIPHALRSMVRSR